MNNFDSVAIEQISAKDTVLDVREDYEWEQGHIAGALHIPLEQLPLRIEELDPDADLYVICRTGGRSMQATQWLNGNGYTAHNVLGGMGAWQDAQKEMVSENGQDPVVR